MRTCILLALLFIVTGVLAEEDGDVIVLTKSNFDDIVNNADLILVEFYAPWCGHCKKLAPEYAQASTILKKNDPPVLLGKVDATVESELGNRFGVSGYPTMKTFRKGTASDYKGPRDSAGIVSYMKKQVGDSAKLLSSIEELDKFTDNRDISVIGFFQTKSSLHKLFVQVADENREDFRFGLVSDSKVMEAKQFGEGIVIFKTFDDKQPVVYSGSENKDAIINWVYQNSLPFIGEYSKDTENRYRRANKPILKAYFDVDFAANLKRTNYFVNRIKKAVEGISGVMFSVVNKNAYKDEMEKFGLTPSADIQVAIDDVPKTLKFKMTKEFNVESVKEFVSDYVAGKLKPFIKSQPIPENKKGDVAVVVGETFNEIVMDKSKDVLFEMYAPWCGHCKKLEPIYNELAESLQDVDSVVIAKMDATANDSPHPQYQARGYPTIVFAPANNKDSPIPYKGERTVKAMSDFIKQNAAIKFDDKKVKKDKKDKDEHKDKDDKDDKDDKKKKDKKNKKNKKQKHDDEL